MVWCSYDDDGDDGDDDDDDDDDDEEGGDGEVSVDGDNKYNKEEIILLPLEYEYKNYQSNDVRLEDQILWEKNFKEYIMYYDFKEHTRTTWLVMHIHINMHSAAPLVSFGKDSP